MAKEFDLRATARCGWLRTRRHAEPNRCLLVVFGAVWSLLLVPPAMAGQGLVREVEPNGTIATATSLGNPLNGAVMIGNIVPTGDADYYSFAALANDKVYVATATLFADQGQLDSLLEIVNSGGAVQISDNDDGEFGKQSSSIAGWTVPSNGTYFVRVTASGTATQIRPYHLHFQLRRGTPDPETEPAPVATLPASGWVRGNFGSSDEDRFSLTLNAGDTVFASLDLDPGPPPNVPWNGRVGLRPFQGITLGLDDLEQSAPRSEALFMTVKDAGTYEVQVYVSAGTGDPNFAYELSVTVHPNTPESSSCTTYSSVDVPKTIVDGPGTQVTSQLIVPGHPRIADLNVSVSLTQ